MSTRLRALVLLVLLTPLATWSSSAAGKAQSLPGSDLPIREEEEAPAPAEPKPGEEPKPAEEAPTPASPPKPAPYSLPWHLRPAVAVTAIRFDNTVALQDSSGTIVSFLSASWKFLPDTMIAVRQGWVNDAPNRENDRSAFTNLGVSATYAPRLGSAFRLATSGGAALPTGEGGGNAPTATTQKAIASGVYARSAMDNAMFSPNDLGLFLGLALAYIEDGLTLQVEATVFHLTRLRGETSQADVRKTNTTWGAHVGYFIVPGLSVGAEVRYQDFLAPPKAVEKAPLKRDCATVALGVRGHVMVGTHAFRPGIAYAHPLDDPMAAAGYRVVQLDLPFVF